MEKMKETENKKCLYLLKDKKVNEIVGAFLLRDFEVLQHFSELANDVKSPFYKRQEDFVIYNFGVCNDDNFSFQSLIDPDIRLLSEFVDEDRVRYQYLAETLNFLPPGYFKMNDEQLKDVRERLNDAINELAKERFGEINIQSLIDENHMLQARVRAMSLPSEELN